MKRHADQLVVVLDKRDSICGSGRREVEEGKRIPREAEDARCRRDVAASRVESDMPCVRRAAERAFNLPRRRCPDAHLARGIARDDAVTPWLRPDIHFPVVPAHHLRWRFQGVQALPEQK